ncbi:unnamed protein product [Owenia fusiformis]|uniref:Serpin domain-containing protein n=1 Tax=Owenia fusiformis TaxID=6347 RepID=A0A8S4P3L1_OWEFU|nr:unnamed protein product [Owenia fusiformis]
MRTFELLILSAVVIVIKTKKSDNSVEKSEKSCSKTELPPAINTFSLELYKKLAAKDKGKDVFFSSFSITTALSMLLLGADENTKEEMEEVLHVAGIQSDDLHSMFSCLYSYLQDGGILKMANRLYPNITLDVKQDFINNIQKYYGVTLEPLNFRNVEESRRVINNWVEKQTNGQIKEMLQHGDVDALTINVLVNAIYFKGEWKEKFDVEDTKQIPFVVNSKTTVLVDMMTAASEYNYQKSSELRTDFIELPYNQKGYPDLSMVLLVPHDNFGLEELEAKLTIENLQQNTEKMSPMKARIFLPKLKLNSRYGLSTILTDLGMNDLFSPQDVDLTQLTDDPRIEVSEIIHEASVVVNEEGTEAVAATSVIGMRHAGPPIISCNHPFIFLIRDVLSETIVFMGRVVHPGSTSSKSEPQTDPSKSRESPVVLPEHKLMEEEVQDPTDSVLVQNCRENCKVVCRAECFKDVQKQLKIGKTRKAKNHFKKNKKNFLNILMLYKKCKGLCRTPCVRKCGRRAL